MSTIILDAGPEGYGCSPGVGEQLVVDEGAMARLGAEARIEGRFEHRSGIGARSALEAKAASVRTAPVG